MREDRILALDLATCTGFACGSLREGVVEHGSHTLPKTGANVGLFLVFFRKFLTDTIIRLAPGALIYESPILFGMKSNITTLRKLYCLGGMTEVVAQDLNLDCTEENVETITTHFLGKGKGVPRRGDERKRATVARCVERGWDPGDHNAADALALLDLALSLKSPGHALQSTPLFGAGGARQ